MMSNTLYQGQRLRDLLNMNAGDIHTVHKRSLRVMGSNKHHRDMGLDKIAALIDGTKKMGNAVFYNNVLTDIIADYIVFKSGDKYNELMRSIFQDKIKLNIVFLPKNIEGLLQF